MADTLERLAAFLRGEETEGSDPGMAKAAKEKKEEGESGEGGEDNEDYNPAYMKKHMKRYMKENQSEMEGHMKEMSKAARTVIERETPEGMEDADAVMIEGTEMFKAFSDFARTTTETLAKAFGDLDARMKNLEDSVNTNRQIAEATGAALLKAASSVDTIASTPVPTKGVVAGTVELPGSGDGEPVAPLAKARSLGIEGIRRVLIKAAKEGNTEACRVMTEVESCFGQLERIPGRSLELVARLAQQGIN